jgi:hypothetical protein
MPKKHTGLRPVVPQGTMCRVSDDEPCAAIEPPRYTHPEVADAVCVGSEGTRGVTWATLPTQNSCRLGRRDSRKT